MFQSKSSILSIIYIDDIIIEYSLESDFKALKFVHMNVVKNDMICATKSRRKHFLKHLTACLLKKEIHTNASPGHYSLTKCQQCSYASRQIWNVEEQKSSVAGIMFIHLILCFMLKLTYWEWSRERIK